MLSNSNGTLTLPVAAITGPQIIFNGLGGDDTLVVDLASSLGKTVAYSGGAATASDKLTIQGGTLATATLNHTNATDGSVLAGTNTVNYTGLEAVDFAGTTIASLVLNLPDLVSPADQSLFKIVAGNLVVASNPLTLARQPVDTLSLSGVASLTVNGRGGDDNFTLHPSMSAFTGTFTFNSNDIVAWNSSHAFGANNFAVTGFLLTLDGATITTSTGNQTYNGILELGLNSPATLSTTGSGEIILGGTVAVNFRAGSRLGPGNLNLGGATRSFSIQNPTSSPATDLLISAAMSNGGLSKTGPGTLTLSGANTYAGPTAVQNGTLQLAGGVNRLPIGTTLTLGSGATGGILDLNNQNQQVAGLAMSGSGTNRVLDSAVDGITPVLTVVSYPSPTTSAAPGNLGRQCGRGGGVYLRAGPWSPNPPAPPIRPFRPTPRTGPRTPPPRTSKPEITRFRLRLPAPASRLPRVMSTWR